MESGELADKGAAQGKEQECKEEEDSAARAQFGGEGSKDGAERRESEYFVEQDVVLPIAQPTSEPGLTCSGLDTGMEIEDFINETVEEGKSEKPVEHQHQHQFVKASTTAATTLVRSAVTPEASNPAALSSEEVVVVVEKVAEVVTEQVPVEKSDKPEGNETSASGKPVTMTVGENEETIDGAALKRMEVAESTTPTPTPTPAPAGDGSGNQGDAAAPPPSLHPTTDSAETVVVSANPKASGKAPKSCVVNMASDDNPSKKDGQRVGEGDAAAAKVPAKRGRKPGSKRAEKAGTENASKSRSSSGEPKVPQVTLDFTQQPFSDAQQVQLRAQILVYGAIIQGSIADENLMGAAFTDISKVRNLESFESQAGASKTLWEKTWRAASQRLIKAAGGGKPSSPPAPRPPMSPRNLPKSPSSKGKKNTTAAAATTTGSEFPSVSAVANSVMTMASATVASWNSARARAPSPAGSAVDSWLFRSGFPFAHHLAPQQQWGVAVPPPMRGNWGAFSQASFGSQPPPPFPLFAPGQAMTPPPAAAAAGAEAGNVSGKRKRLDTDPESTPAPGSSSQLIPSDVSPATAGLLEDSDNALGIVSLEELENLRSGEDLLHRLESAKKKAEEAASAASSMVEQSQAVWEDIKEKQRSNNMSNREAQLASSLAAVNAAASVAKAAAAAANVAYAAALQARAMANEIVSTRKDAENDSDPTVTHVTQGDERSAQLKSAIAGAKVAMKQHVETTALAFTRAENLEAVVRAAELAAQAASQAGKVIATGDPTSLASNEKAAKPRVSGKRNVRSKAVPKKKSKSSAEEEAEAAAASKDQNEEVSPEAQGAAQADEAATTSAAKGDEGVIGSKSGATQGDVVDAEPSDGLVEDKQQQQQQRPEEVTVGSHVEIVPDEDGLQGVWFSAKVKTLNGDDALVVYDELLDDDGNGKLEEWVNITSRIDNAPRVRPAHPMTNDGGMRKRRRASQGYQKCSIDDHVDVWMRDGWWEGIVQSVDESLVTVFFPGDGDTEVTKSWNLRPSLVWKDDAWRLWRDTVDPKSKKQKIEESSSQEQETPEKRKKPESGTPGSSDSTPRLARSGGAKPTKRRKFSDVIEKDQARDTSITPSPPPPASGRKPASKKPTPPPPGSKRSSAQSRKTKPISTKVNDEGEVRKSGRMIHPTSKLLEGLETTPKVTGKKSGIQQTAS